MCLFQRGVGRENGKIDTVAIVQDKWFRMAKQIPTSLNYEQSCDTGAMFYRNRVCSTTESCTFAGVMPSTK
jgi:hypothetical protein